MFFRSGGVQQQSQVFLQGQFTVYTVLLLVFYLRSDRGHSYVWVWMCKYIDTYIDIIFSLRGRAVNGFFSLSLAISFLPLEADEKG